MIDRCRSGLTLRKLTLSYYLGQRQQQHNHETHKRSFAAPRESNTTASSQRNPKERTNKVWAPHRGIFRPKDSAESSPSAPFDKADLFTPTAPSNSNRAQAASLHRGPDRIVRSQQPQARGLPPGVAEQPTEEVRLVQCGSCGRSFNTDSIAKHEKLCAKVFKSKRKPFNSAKSRLTSAIQSADDAYKVKNIIRQGGISKEEAQAAARKKRPTKWREKSAKLRSIKGGTSQGAPPVEEFVPCPNCGRTFNEQAASRHIPKCKDIKARPQQLKRRSGRYASSRRL